MPAVNAAIAASSVALGQHAIDFDEKKDLLFCRMKTLPFHANGMRSVALDRGGGERLAKIYYSVGGGFVVSDEVAADGTAQKRIAPDTTILPYPFHTGAELLALAEREGASIAQIMRANERHWRGDAEMDAELLEVWRVMQARVERGCSIDGELPGPWRVKRRAPALYRKLSRPGAGPSTELRTGLTDPLAVLDWVNLWALAVNEENAAEIGMEHHLGLTCDPVGGLVQIPCIERNAIAAAEAINAARMALAGDATHYASLDQVIKTMRETGADMKTTYKETARGGLAVNVVAC